MIFPPYCCPFESALGLFGRQSLFRLIYTTIIEFLVSIQRKLPTRVKPEAVRVL